MSAHNTRSLLRAAGMGAVAGLAGGLAMSRFGRAWRRVADDHDAQPRYFDGSAQELEGTRNAATALGQRIGMHLTNNDRQLAAAEMHYLVSVAFGAMYGLLSEAVPAVRSGMGTWWGLALWSAGDEFSMPRLGLTKPPREYPAAERVHAFTEHLLYGFTTELACRGLRKIA